MLAWKCLQEMEEEKKIQHIHRKRRVEKVEDGFEKRTNEWNRTGANTNYDKYVARPLVLFLDLPFL